MKRIPSVSRLLLISMLAGLLISPAAQAYRPFEGTDAGVAETGVFELEFSPFGYLRNGPSRLLMGPAVVGNFGLANNVEVVIEGRASRLQGGRPEDYRAVFGDTALSVKHLFREGSLQEGTGLSLAAECGVLLPEYHGSHSTGATCAGIASQRLAHATLHFNAGVARTREHTTTHTVSLIAEGDIESAVRPVMELLAENEVHVGQTRSALVGLIWKHSEELSTDIAFRHGRSGGEIQNEVRMGLTWSYAMHH